MADIAERSQRIVGEWLKRQADEGPGTPDPLNIASAFLEMTARLMANPAKLMQAQLGFWQDYMSLWQNTARRMMGMEADAGHRAPTRRTGASATTPGRTTRSSTSSSSPTCCRRATCRTWSSRPTGSMRSTAQKVDFYARQFIDAMSPSNFLLTNPEVLRKTAETGGENLIKGLHNLLTDLERGKGQLRIKMTDMDAFRVGENIAVTPGKVVYPERPDAAYPIQSDDREGAEAPAADHSAVDQQVLHPRFAAAEQLRPLGGGAGPHGVHRFVGEPGRARSPRRASTTTCARAFSRRWTPSEAATGEKRRATPSAIASAARCWPRRWPGWRRTATTASNRRRSSSR